MLRTILAVWAISFCLPISGISQKCYKKSIRQYRKTEKEHFRDPKQSALRENAADFPGFDYFKIDPSYRFTCTVIPPAEETEVKFMTSSGKIKIFNVYGQVNFTVEETPCTLTLYRRKNADYLFLPFKDGTTHEITYGGGRYLELPVPESNEIVIDFNKAFNPYCAYASGWNCPIVPMENILPVRIPAGVIGFKGIPPTEH